MKKTSPLLTAILVFLLSLHYLLGHAADNLSAREIALAQALADTQKDWNSDEARLCRSLSGDERGYRTCMAAALFSQGKEPREAGDSQPP